MNDSSHAPCPNSSKGCAAAAALLVAVLLLLMAGQARAQSQDISYPTPASTNEIKGTITARDIGDARLTRHFYVLAGTPGDLIFTVTSNNLNGDVDLFTAGSLRPLGKVSMYAAATPTSVSKTIFLRQRESLILRVEARSANDNEGSYGISFAGTFEPVMTAATPPPDENNATLTASDRTDKSVRRVTSTGARIEEPEVEAVAGTEASPGATPTTTGSSTETATATTTPGGTETSTTTPVEPTAKPEPARTTRTRRPRNRRNRTRPQPAAPSEPATESAAGDTNANAQPALNPRLIIETRDGMRTERFMSTVRSVTVQNGQIVIVSNEGKKTERILMSTVLRMSIEP